MEIKHISKEEAKKIIDNCESLEKAIQIEKPCFSWGQLDEIKEILNF